MDKKWNLQDIKPSSSRSSRPVPAPSRPTESYTPVASSGLDQGDAATDVAEATSSIDTPKSQTRSIKPPKKRSRMWKFVAGALLLFVLLVFVGGQFTAKTDLMVQPRTETPNVNSQFTAYTNPEAGQLGYELLTLEAEGERQVTATGQTEEVSLPATGVITIRKTTAGEQRLIATTRFEGPDGAIFRIDEGVTVPGGTVDEPGTVSVAVTADEAGVEGNVPANTRFTVPGLESDTTLFNAISATNAEAFSGGFAGTRVVVEDAALTTAQESIRAELQEALKNRLPSEQPADFVSFAGSEKFVSESLPATAAADGAATVKEKVVLEIPVFQKAAFAQFIAGSVVPGYEGGVVRIEDYAAFGFAYTASSSEIASLAAEGSFDFTLTGRPLLVWEYDQTTLKTDLLGASQSSLTSILGAYPAIERAEATFKPFWKKSFPDTGAKISITEVLTWPE